MSSVIGPGFLIIRLPLKMIALGLGFISEGFFSCYNGGSSYFSSIVSIIIFLEVGSS